MTHASILLMAPRDVGNAPCLLLVPLVPYTTIFRSILDRPQRREAAKHKAMVEALKRGDEVVTGGGIIGTVVHAESDRVTIKTAENTRLVVEKGRIAKVVSAKAEVT